MMDISNIQPVVKGRICCGCGACSVICPQRAIGIVEGRSFNYAQIDQTKCARCGRCVAVCPSVSLLTGAPPVVSGAARGEISHCPAYANDPETRREAASGGFVTGLLAGLLDARAIDAAVMVAADPARPLHNRSFVAKKREDILASRGSRYAPASACVGLKEVLDVPGRYAFVGKGCEVTALRKLQAAEPVLRERVALAIGIFCAQTPARTRTAALITAMGVDPKTVKALRYRGPGWPGNFTAVGTNGVLCETPYRKAWDFLAAGTPALRCFLCGDGMAEEADLSVGDPWGLPDDARIQPGLSYVIVRNSRGQRAAESGAAVGAVTLSGAPAEWVAERLRVEERRRETALRRYSTYRALWRLSGVREAFAANRFAYLPTFLRQRLKINYY